MTPTPDSPRVATIKSEEAEAAIGTLTLAFGSDPTARWTWPRADAFLRHFPALARAFGNKTFELGLADQSEGFAGVALWLPPGVGPDEEAMSRIVEETVPAEKRPEFEKVFEQMAAYHPEEPHWYLPLIGVDPARQGERIGGRLMEAGLARCDAARQPAYLESSNPRNIAFYERLGFAALGSIQHGSSPTLVPMLRKPRAAR